MTKKEILKMTGLDESEFYKKYPTQEHFMAEYGGRITPYKKGGIVDHNDVLNMMAYAKGGIIGVQSDYPTHQMMYHGADASDEFNYNQQFKKGGWIKGAINPAHKGWCTPLSNPHCTGHRRALALRFKHGDLHKKAMGGEITIADKYANGGTVDAYQLMGMPTPKMYSLGGILQNTGALLADNALSVVGAENVADNNNWYAKGDPSTKGFKNVSKVTNKLQKVAGQIGATVIGGPAAGAAMGSLQNAVGSIDTPNNQTAMENQGQWGQIGNAVGGLASMATPFIGTGQGTSSTASAKYGGYITPYKDNFYGKNLENPYSFPKFAYGGEAQAHEDSNAPQYIPIEVEKKEKLVRPIFGASGNLLGAKQIRNYQNYPFHNADGSPNPGGYTEAQEGDVVLSARLKPSTPSPTKKDLRNTAIKSPLYPSYSELYDVAHRSGDDLLKKAIVSNQMKRVPDYKARYGGVLRRYGGGSIVTSIGNFNPQTQQTPYASWYGSFGQPMMNIGGSMFSSKLPQNPDPFDAGNGSITDLNLMNSSTPQQWNTRNYSTNSDNPSSYGASPQMAQPIVGQDTSPWAQDKTSGGKNYLEYGMMAAPVLYNLGRGLFEKPYSFKPQIPTTAQYVEKPDYSTMALDQAYSTGKATLKGNLPALISHNINYGVSKQNLVDQYRNAYKQQLMEAKMRDAASRAEAINQAAMFNQQNRAAKENMTAAALNQLGQTGASIYSDRLRYGAMNDLTDYEVDPKTGQIIYKGKGKR